MKSKHILGTRKILIIILTLILFSQGCGSKNQQTAHLRNIGNGICQDTVAGLMWQSGKSQTIKTFEEAKRYVENLRLGGYTDWRLPTRHELHDLVYLFDLHLNGDCDFTIEGKYWSGGKSGKGKAGGWEISANQCDPARQYFHSLHGHVRAVRP